MGASKLAQELMSICEIEERCQRLERHGKVPLQAILILKQLDVLQQHVEASIGLALDALSEQLEQNYKTKDWSRRVRILTWLNNLRVSMHLLVSFLKNMCLNQFQFLKLKKRVMMI